MALDVKARNAQLSRIRSQIDKYRQQAAHATDKWEIESCNAEIAELEEEYRKVDKFYYPTIEERRERERRVAQEDYPNEFIHDYLD